MCGSVITYQKLRTSAPWFPTQRRERPKRLHTHCSMWQRVCGGTSYSRLSSPPRISIPISIALAAGSQKEDLQRLRRDSPRCTPGSRRRSTRTGSRRPAGSAPCLMRTNFWPAYRASYSARTPCAGMRTFGGIESTLIFLLSHGASEEKLAANYMPVPTMSAPSMCESNVAPSRARGCGP